ncbi:hypothetical protein ACFLZB_01645 [Nanoarchaeota archaeon]
MLKNKKAQTIGQVFIYIMAIIIFAAILIFGYKAISEFIDRGESVGFITFKTDLEKSVKTIYSDYGSVTIYNVENPLRVPGKYEEICFVDLSKPLPSSGSFCANHPIACDAWGTAYQAGISSGTDGWQEGEQNVFLRPLGEIAIKVYKITVDSNSNNVDDDSDGYLCFNLTQGRLNMRIEGKGDHAFISAI